MKFKYIIYFEKENDETFKIFSYLFNYYNYSKMMKILKVEPKTFAFFLYIKYRFNNNTRFLDVEKASFASNNIETRCFYMLTIYIIIY